VQKLNGWPPFCPKGFIDYALSGASTKSSYYYAPPNSEPIIRENIPLASKATHRRAIFTEGE
jgi:hypothetical protein